MTAGLCDNGERLLWLPRAVSEGLDPLLLSGASSLLDASFCAWLAGGELARAAGFCCCCCFWDCDAGFVGSLAASVYCARAACSCGESTATAWGSLTAASNTWMAHSTESTPRPSTFDSSRVPTTCLATDDTIQGGNGASAAVAAATSLPRPLPPAPPPA